MRSVSTKIQLAKIMGKSVMMRTMWMMKLCQVNKPKNAILFSITFLRSLVAFRGISPYYSIHIIVQFCII